MNRYLTVIMDERGQWTADDLTQAYVFEAHNDKDAWKIMASYMNGKNGFVSEFLARITGGLQVKMVQRVPDNVKDLDITEFSHEYQQEINFEHLFPGLSMIPQLQPFDPEVRKNRLEAIKKCEKKDHTDTVKTMAMPLPKRGEDIYIPSAMYLDRGHDDVVGGLAKVESVFEEMSGGKQVHFISVKEVPGNFNWEQHIAVMQDEYKKGFGKNRAYPDPDDRPQFNKP